MNNNTMLRSQVFKGHCSTQPACMLKQPRRQATAFVTSLLQVGFPVDQPVRRPHPPARSAGTYTFVKAMPTMTAPSACRWGSLWTSWSHVQTLLQGHFDATALYTPSFVPCLQVGRLWTSLSDYYIRRGLIEKARDVYEEGLTTVVTVRDFSLLFDTLTEFESSLLSYKMQVGALARGSAGTAGTHLVHYAQFQLAG